ncbi:MAG: penicillin-binding transpeptidase domain-containing protein [Roseburia sp.]|nr:penicillin-binding transpeptidase domain-containing protein [Roseburia sp.]
MISAILDYIRTLVRSRIFALIVIYIVLFSILVSRLFYLQIVQGETYDEKAAIKNTKIKTLKSSRGKIYDCNGKLLASNEQSYSITIEDTGELEDNKTMNEMILKCISLIEKHGDKISVEFPIEINKKGRFKFNVDKNAQLRFKREIYYLKSVDELSEEQKKMTAEECFRYIRTSTKANAIHFFDPLTGEEKTDEEKAKKEQDYDDRTALEIMAIRYALMMNTYQKYEPVTISSDVCAETVAAIKENSANLTGVEVSEDAKRVYYDSYYFSHIIGYTGLISSDTLATMKENNDDTYTAADQIGKTGIESTYEDQLKGKKGSETLVVDSSSRVVETKDHVDAVAGNDIYLTIDSELQKAAYKLTEKMIAGVLISKLNNSKSAGSKGKKADDIRVPIYDVYSAILENGLVDITKFSAPDASSLEKNVYDKFTSEKKSTIKMLKRQLAYNYGVPGDDVSETTKEYLDYIYSMLRTDEVIASDKMDKTDETYNKYANGKISLSRFLIYAISNNWLNLEALNVGDDYYSTEEIYSKLKDYVFESLAEDTAFDKKIYHTLVYNDVISGREVCLLLYEQGYLKKDKAMAAKLKTGMQSPFGFVKSKIRSLEISPGELGLTPCAGVVVVTDPKTGKIKALVSYPSYDNNKFANSVNNDYFSKINSNSASPLLNRATQQKMAPGSTYKMVSATTALEEGIINPHSTVSDKVVFDKIGPQSPKCWSKSGHGTINVSQAIQHSCNYFFYEMGYQLSGLTGGVLNNERGLKKLEKYADIYGLTDLSGIELSEAEPNVSDMDAVRSAIGQGTNSYTPVQLARYVSTIANGETCYDLTLVDRTVDVSKDKEKKNKAKVRNKLNIQSTTLDAIRSGMYMVVNNGSQKPVFESVPVKVAGKTGTAQISANEPNHALFVSFAPYESPEISVTVVIPNAFTSSNAASLASYIYRYYFDEGSRKKLLKNSATSPVSNSGGVTD